MSKEYCISNIQGYHGSQGMPCVGLKGPECVRINAIPTLLDDSMHCGVKLLKELHVYLTLACRKAAKLSGPKPIHWKTTGRGLIINEMSCGQGIIPSEAYIRPRNLSTL